MKLVAPCMGAWIETHFFRRKSRYLYVAPCMGAWIETGIIAKLPENLKKSHPVWVRGLKQQKSKLNALHNQSHPVWVRGLKHR